MTCLPVSYTNPGIRASLQEWAALDRDLSLITENAPAMWQETRDAQEDAWSKGGFGVERAQPAGLVSVPTSGKDAEAATRAAAAVLRDDLQAITLDPVARRLSKLRMNVGFAARGHAVSERGHRGERCVMVTLTYAGTNEDWSPRHISDYLSRCRKYLKTAGFTFRYVWVAELQKRGVIHYHVALWLPPSIRLPKPDKSGWWPHGMSNVVVARSAPAYLLKYLSKDTSKTFGDYPKHARIYGAGGLDYSIRRCRRWLNLPKFVQGRSDVNDQWKRRVGGGWEDPQGLPWASEWQRAWVGDAWMVIRVCQHERLVESDGPFSWVH